MDYRNSTTEPKSFSDKTVISSPLQDAVLNGVAQVPDDHQFLQPNADFKPISLYCRHASLVTSDGSVVAETGFTQVSGRHTVYNFTVDDLHTYIAGGYRVHNDSLEAARELFDVDSFEGIALYEDWEREHNGENFYAGPGFEHDFTDFDVAAEERAQRSAQALEIAHQFQLGLVGPYYDYVNANPNVAGIAVDYARHVDFENNPFQAQQTLGLSSSYYDFISEYADPLALSGIAADFTSYSPPSVDEVLAQINAGAAANPSSSIGNWLSDSQSPGVESSITVPDPNNPGGYVVTYYQDGQKTKEQPHYLNAEQQAEMDKTGHLKQIWGGRPAPPPPPPPAPPEPPVAPPSSPPAGPPTDFVDPGTDFQSGDGGYGDQNGYGPSSGYGSDAWTPIVLDLDGDGVELVDRRESTAYFDINGDGYRTNLGWAGADDGFLVYDLDPTGDISQSVEVSFISYVEGAKTDLEGLVYFDDNGPDGQSDGVLDAHDTEWARFGVWQDLDQDGTTDEGEFKTLTEMGIEAITLSSDGNQVDIDSNRIFGMGSYRYSNGDIKEFADVGVSSSPVGYRYSEDGTLEVQSSELDRTYYDSGFNDAYLHLATGWHNAAYGGDGNDHFVAGQEFNVVLDGGTGDDTLEGGSGDDWITGGDGADHLIGGAGDDTLFIDQEDLIDGTVLGGDGYDTALLESGAGVTIDLKAHELEQVIGNQGDDVLSATYTAADAVGVSLDGDAGNDTLSGGAGDDTLIGGGGIDRLSGGAGDDEITIDADDDLSFIDGGSGNDALIISSTSGLTIDANSLNVETVIGGYGGDTLSTSGASDVVLAGEYGDDTLSGGGGNDILRGGYGDDTLSGNGGNDVLDGGAGNDRLTGGDGDDIYKFGYGYGLDVINNFGASNGYDVVELTQNVGRLDLSTRRDGDDLVFDLQGSEDALTVESWFTSADNRIDLTYFSGLASTFGAAGDDGLNVFTAQSDASYMFWGMGGSDTLTGNEGNDVLVGGEGADSLAGAGGSDTASYQNSDAGVTVNLTTNTSAGGHATGDILTEIENLDGSGHADILTGDAADNQLTGNAGDDTLSGGAGNDGLIGGEGDDILDGGAGDDVLTGGIGADQLDGGLGQDTLVYSRSDQGVYVNLEANKVGGGDATGDVISGFENIIGSDQGDILFGDSGDNLIDGGAGFDLLQGGGGNDIIIGNTGFDIVNYDGNSGAYDVVFDSASRSYTVTDKSALFGNDGTDVLTGVERIIFAADGVDYDLTKTPIAQAAALSVALEGTANWSLAAHGGVKDADGNVDFSYALETAASNGVVAVNADGSYTYTANGGYEGTDSFSYRVVDAVTGMASVATVEVAVGAPETNATTGAEIQVNTHTAGEQNHPSTTALVGGGFVITWDSWNQDGHNFGIFGQRYDGSGAPIDDEFQINTQTNTQQTRSATTALADGGFVVTWESLDQDGDSYGVYGQRYDASGAAAGDEFQANTHTANSQGSADVADLTDGGFVVTWMSLNQDGSGGGIYGQRYTVSGAATGDEFLVNTQTQHLQNSPAVTGLSGGGFIVTWDSQYQINGDSSEVYGQRYDASGNANGDEFLINTQTDKNQTDPNVAALSDGGFVVIWESVNNGTTDRGIYGQKFDSAGDPLGDEFKVNTDLYGNHRDADVTVLPDGGFVVTWNSEYEDDGNSYGVYGQRFDADGVSAGDEFLINSETLGHQRFSSVAGLSGGGFVVSWYSENQDGDGSGIYARIIDVPKLRSGTQSSDLLIGDDSVEILAGGAGDDYLKGGSGDNTLFAGSGDDQLIGGAGDDTLSGGSGDDTVIYTGARSDYEVLFDAASGTFSVTDTNAADDDAGSDSLSGVESVLFTGADATDDADDTTLDLTASPPAALDSSIQISENGSAVWNLSGVGGTADANGDVSLAYAIEGLASFVDVDHPAVEDWFVTASGNGYVRIIDAATGAYAFDPAGSYTGEDSFDYRVEDNATGIASLATVSVDVTPSVGATVGGTEFQVNTYTTINQRAPAIASMSDGSFVVTWESAHQDLDGYGVYAQLYDGAGNAQGDEFRVNSHTAAAQEQPAITALQDDGFVVVWQSYNQDGSLYGVYGQRYDSTGSAVDGEFLVNTYTTHYQHLPDVTTLTDGSFVVSWISHQQNSTTLHIFGQRFDATGAKIGDEFQVTDETIAGQTNPKMTALSDGGFVVSWQSDNAAGNNLDVHAQRYDASGAMVGTEFQINSYTDNHQYGQSLTGLSDGGFLITWRSEGQDGDRSGVYGRRYDATGTATSAEFLVNTQTQEGQANPSVTELSDGGFIITWASEYQDGSDAGVYGQRFDVAGNTVGDEFLVNSYITGDQSAPAVAALQDGSFAVTWESLGQDGNSSGIFAKIFESAATLTGEAGNDVLTGAGYDDVLSGQAGDDQLQGNAGDDTLIGGAGDDQLNGGEGDDTLTGGTGSDTAVYAGAASDFDVRHNAADGTITVTDTNAADGNLGTDTLTGVESVLFTGADAADDADDVVLDLASPPAAFGGTVQMVEGARAIGTLTASGGSGNGDASLSYSLVGLTAFDDATHDLADNWFVTSSGNGYVRIIDAATATYEYDPAGGSVGEDSFEFRVEDTATGIASVATVFVDTAVAEGALPVGSEFKVNSYTSDAQKRPAIAYLTNGDFIVTWQSEGQDGSSTGIYGQRFGGAGEAIGDEFKINSYTQSGQDDPSITSLSDGGFVVTWTSYEQDGSWFGVFGQRFDASGNVAGDEFQVNTYTQGFQINSSVTSLSGGGFVISWASPVVVNGELQTMGQRYDGAGVPVGGEFQLSTDPSLGTQMISSTQLSDGGFVVAWTSYVRADATHDVHGRRYDASGAALGDVFQINSYTAESQANPSIAGLSEGGFVATWQSKDQDGDDDGIYGQLYDVNGSALGLEFQVNSITNLKQSAPSVTALTNGGFVVTWKSMGHASDSEGIFAQKFDHLGGPVGDEFLVNTFTDRWQGESSVTATADGGFVVAWTSEGQDGSGNGVFAQIYAAGANISGDSGNDVLVGGTHGDIVDGLAGDDQLIGNGGDDTLSGGAGDDQLTGGEGDDTLAGGSGIDRAVYAGAASDYDVLYDAETGAYSVTDTNAVDGDLGSDTLTGVESVLFTGADAQGDADDVTLDLAAPPAAFDGTVQMVDDSLARGVLAGSGGVTDANGDVLLSYTIEGLSAFGDVDHPAVEDWFITASGKGYVRITDLATGEYEYDPVDGSSGEDSFEFRVEDDTTGIASVATINVDIAPAPHVVSVGSEFQVNSYIQSDQNQPAIATLSDGGFVIAWQSNGQDGSSNGIYGQRYSSSGAAVGDEFRANTFTQSRQDNPAITSLSGGGFVIAWDSGENQDGNSTGVFAQRYDAFGVPNGAEFQVNSFSTSVQQRPSIAALLDGGFLATWESFGADGNTMDVFGQRFNASGATVGVEFRINAETNQLQLVPVATALSDGGFVVVWESNEQDGDGWGVFAQRYDSLGLTNGSEFQVNAHTSENQATASVTGLSGGGFVVTWVSSNQDGSGYGVYGQRYDQTGTELGEEFIVNSYTDNSQNGPSVTALDDGGFVVIWYSVGQDDTDLSSGVFGQRYDASGGLISTEFQINSYTAGFQGNPAVSALPDAGFVVTWHSYDQDGSGIGVFAQVFASTVILSGDSGNDVLVGGTQADIVNGLAGDDQLIGNGGDDTLSGGAGDDQLTGGEGDDTLAGGSGIDRAVYAGAASDYDVLYDAETGAYSVTDTNAVDGDMGSDTLTGVESVLFTGADALDDADDVSFDLTTPPAAIGGSVQMVEGRLVQGELNGAGGAENVDGNVVLSYTLEGLSVSVDTGHMAVDGWYTTAHGFVRITDTASGDYEYDPIDGYAGEDSFNFRVTDSTSGIASLAKITVDTAVSSTIGLVGSEFQVNTNIVSTQGASNVVALAGGGFVVTWDSYNQDGSDTGVYGQRYDQAGAPLGAEFQINTHTQYHQRDTSTIAMQDGGFLVTWESDRPALTNFTVVGQRYDADGVVNGGEFVINTYTPSVQRNPSSTALADGGFVVTWESNVQDGMNYGIYGQRFDTFGLTVGSEFKINTVTQNYQDKPDIAALSDGGFVVTWTSDGQSAASYDVYAQRFDSAAATVGVEFQINTYTQFDQRDTSVTGLIDGGFVVTWGSTNQDGSLSGVYGQRYGSSGAMIGDEFKVSTRSEDDQSNPDVIALPDGGFLVIWHSAVQDGDSYGIFGRRYDASGVPVNSEFQINTFTEGSQAFPSIAMLPNGGFVVTWTSNGHDNGIHHIFAQIFDAAFELSGTDGNDVLVGGDLNDQLTGDVGNDLLIGGAGDDTLAGGSGDDTVQFAGNLIDYQVSYDATSDTYTAIDTNAADGDDGTDTITGVETLRFADQDVTAETAKDWTQASDGSALVIENGSASWKLAGSGGDGALSYAITGLQASTDPSHAAVDGWFETAHGYVRINPAVAGDYEYDPVDAYVGEDSFDFKVTDGQGLSSVATVSVDVAPETPLAVGGDEFQVNTHTTERQERPSIASLSDGSFIVAWQSDSQDGHASGIYAQRYDRAGNSLGDEFLINTHTAQNQGRPSVSASNDGGFIIAWMSGGQDGSGDSVHGQRFNSAGASVGDEFQVNTYTLNDQAYPSVTTLTDSGFVVTWSSRNQDGSTLGVYGQRFSASGEKTGVEFQVNTYTDTEQSDPKIASLTDGGFIVSWDSAGQDGSGYGVFAQRYDASGATVGVEFQVNTYTDGTQNGALITGFSDGGFLTSWGGASAQNEGGYDVFGRRYNAAGTPIGVEFRINTHTQASQTSQSAAELSDGGFVVTWTSYGDQDGDGAGVYGQRFDAAGTAVGDEFQVNNYTSGFQYLSDVTALPDGGFAVTWESKGQDGDSGGIFAKIYESASTLTGDAGNDVLTGGDYGDVLSGAGGDDLLIGGKGDDTLAGGAGEDTVQFAGNAVDYNVSFDTTTDIFTVTDTNTSDGDDGTDVIAGVETLRFADQDITQEIAQNWTQAADSKAHVGENGLVNWKLTSSDGEGALSYTLNDLTASNDAGHLAADGWFVTAHGFVRITDTATGDYEYDPIDDFVGEDSFDFKVIDERGLASVASVNVDVAPETPLAVGGDEFQVNTYTTSEQMKPSIASLSNGSFVVTWESNSQDGSGYGVYAQRYDRAGIPLGDEFVVNTHTTNNQRDVSVSALPDGGFVVVWMSYLQDGSGESVHGQKFTSAGIPIGAEFLVNTYTTGDQNDPEVAALADGGFVVTWQSEPQDGSAAGVYGQRFSAMGEKLSVEFLVNSFTADAQKKPVVASLSDGGFILAWQSTNQDGSSIGIFAQRYDVSGATIGGEFQVNSYTDDNQSDPSLTGLSDGGFLITWLSVGQDGDGIGIYGRRYDATGTALSVEFRINTETQASQLHPSVSELSDGGFVVTWFSEGQDGDGDGVFGQRYDTAGVPAGPEFQINSFTTGHQNDTAVAALDNGGFAVTWVSSNQDGDLRGIYAKVFESTSTLTGYVGNDVLTGGDFGDVLSGAGGDDLLIGGKGDDTLAGGAGEDTVQFAGNAVDYNVSFDTTTDTFTVTDTNTSDGDDGTDTITSVETLRFADQEVTAEIAKDWTQATDSKAHVGENGLVDWKLTSSDGEGALSYTLNDLTASNDAGHLAADGWFVTANGFVRITDTATGDYEYDPIDDFVGEDSFDFKVIDERGLASVATVNVDVAPEGPASIGGNEIQVNTYAVQSQSVPAISSLSDGVFVVTWQSIDQDGNALGVYAQRYDRAGDTLGDEFLVNTETFHDQSYPSVSALPDDGFVIVWTSYGQDGSSHGIYGQRYSSAGASVGDEFAVNTYTTSYQNHSSIATLADGSFVVSWNSDGQNGISGSDVYGQRFSATGDKIGAEFLVNTETTDMQSNSTIASLSDGGFVVAWKSSGQDGSSSGIFAQRYDAFGAMVEAEFQVNIYTDSTQTGASLTGLSDGGFLITWGSDGQDGDRYGVYGRRYDAAGIPESTEFRINTHTAGIQTSPSVTLLTDGGYVVTWRSDEQDGSGQGVYAQRYDQAGIRVGTEFLVNTYTTYDQTSHVITALSNGGFAATWQSEGQDGDSGGIFTKIFESASNLSGEAGNDYLTGGGYEDVLSGADGDDQLIGLGGNDQLSGGAGDDLLIGGAGSDVLTGGTGEDTASYAGDLADYTVNLNGGGSVTVTDTNAANGEEGTDSLSGVEILQFADQAIYVDGRNNAPFVETQSFGPIDENQAAGVVVGKVVAADFDAGAALSFVITGGNLSGLFAIDTATGEITTTGPLDYETAVSADLVVTVSDGQGGASETTVTVSTGDVNDAPIVVDQDLGSINENGAANEVVGTVVATDADVAAMLGYAITAGNVGDAFVIDAATGQITTTGALNHEEVGSYDLTIEVTDNGTLSDTAQITIAVGDENEAPVIVDQDFGTIDENGAVNEVVGTVVATDVDDGATRTYAITAGNVGDAFVIDTATGEITTTGALDHETVDSYDLTVEVTDNGALTDTAQITIAVGDENEAPVIVDQDFGTINENGVANEVVGTVTATDVDEGATRTYSITAGNVGGAFAIDAVTGEITTTGALDHESVDSYDLTVEVIDNGALTDTAQVTIAVGDINEAPVMVDQDFGAIDENGAANEVVGTVVAADVDDGATRTYAITGGNVGGAFAIDAATGEVTTTGALDHETVDSYDLTVEVTDNGALTDTAQVAIAVGDENEAPVIVDQDFGTINENGSANEMVGTVVATDVDDGATRTYAITGGDVGGAFAIDATTGEITTTGALDHEGADSYDLTVEVTDNGGLTDTAQVTIAVGDINEAPVMVDQDFGSVNENGVANEVVGTMVAADVDDDASRTYAIIAGNTGGAFAINAATGEITTSGALDHETVDSYDLTVEVTDNGGLVDTAQITVSVGDVNEAPALADQNFGPINENGSAGDIVGSVAGSDVDAGTSLTYVITGGNASGLFVIDALSGQITTTGALNYETDASYNLSVEASDGTLTDSGVVTITVRDVNDAPLIIDQALAPFDENQVTGSVVGSVVASDVDAGDTLSYSITSGNADGLFAINAATGEIMTTAPLNHENAASYDLTVRVVDAAGSAQSETVTIPVGDVNEAPVIADQDLGVMAENGEAYAVVGTVVSSDVDAGDTRSYAITAGNIGGAFAIDANGQITTTGALDHEGVDSYDLTIEVTDNGALTDTAQITIAVSDLNETPVIGSQTFGVIAESVAAGTVVGTVVSADPDAGDTRTYTIVSGNAAGLFSIDTSSGQITTTGSLDYELVASHTLDISVTDAGGLADTAAVTINVGDVNESSVVADQTFGVSETAALGTVIGAVSASDPDAGNTFTFAITSGNEDGLFTININTGEILTTGTLDYETATTHDLSIAVTDAAGLTTSAVVTLNVSDVNEVILNSGPVLFGIDEGEVIVVTEVELLANSTDLDGDALSVQNLQLNGSDATVQSFGNGTWLITPSQDYSGEISLSYEVTDGNTTPIAATAAITVANIDDAPVVSAPVVFGVAEEGVLVITKEELLANTTDADNDNLSVGDVQLVGTNGTLTANANGTWTYQPANDFTGDVGLSYTVTDGNSAAIATSAAITVSNSNDAPIVSGPTAFSIDEGGFLVITKAELLANTIDPDGDILDVSNVALAGADGTLVENAGNGTWLFMPNADFSGAVSLTYSVSDGTADAVATTAAITVNNLDDAPVVSAPLSFEMNEDGNLVFTQAQLLANTTDPDGDALSVQNVQMQGANGTFTAFVDAWLYEAPANFSGPVSISYEVFDGTTAVATTLEIDVINIVEGTVGDDVLIGDAHSDEISGDAGNDTLDGGAGDDRLTGGAGDDTYQFGRGYDSDVIDNAGESTSSDKVVFGASVEADQLWFRADGDDLKVDIIGTNDSLTIEGWNAGTDNQVAQFETATGEVLNRAEVDGLVSAMASFSPPALGETELSQDQHTNLDGAIASAWGLGA